ncbi:SRPBCC family protein [Pedobacter sp. SAFR-022]|uniref:SRPBCC family protein n=1 Tax=Pedobacter sp. SAFR-022 TaxID=3436861 RepID=UPI003F7DA248
MENFTTKLILKAKAQDVYEGLTLLISKWWSEMFEGSAEEQGNVFTIRFGSQVYKTMEVEQLVGNEKVSWRVVDALIDLPELSNNTEWVDTRIIWDISITSEGTALALTHVGLTPEIQCYDLCKNGWQSFLYSFNKFLTTGKGVPFSLTESN